MDLAAFLAAKEISLGAVVAQAQISLQLAPGDVLLLCGSLVDGLGNHASDLDLILVTDRNDTPLTSLSDVAFAVGRCLIDVRAMGRGELGALLARFDRWAAAPRVVRAARGFTPDERKLLHRLNHGQVLYGEDQVEALRQPLGASRLARQQLDLAVYMASTLMVDLAGLRGASDLHSMVFVAQELLGHAMDALLARHGLIHPNPKWRVRLLGSVPLDWECEIPGRSTTLPARDLYLSLHRAPERFTAAAVHAHSLAITALCRRLLPAMELRLLGAAPQLPAAWRDPSGTPPSGPALPHLDLEVTIRLTDEGLQLLRLNGSGAAFPLTPDLYALLCFFDGVSDRSLVTRCTTAIWHDDPSAPRLDEALALARVGELLARPLVDESLLAELLRGGRDRG